jgi:hypothetical protein
MDVDDDKVHFAIYSAEAVGVWYAGIYGMGRAVF